MTKEEYENLKVGDIVYSAYVRISDFEIILKLGMVEDKDYDEKILATGYGGYWEYKGFYLTEKLAKLSSINRLLNRLIMDADRYEDEIEQKKDLIEKTETGIEKLKVMSKELKND
jgi:hypothetical protein